MNTTHVFAPILKHYRDENGNLVVEGKATGPDLDHDKQICDPTWLKSAMPDWFQWANIREQHSSIAAGVGQELIQDGDSWNVKSLVTDPNSARKVETGTLKGYSIGISNPRVVKDVAAPGGRIVGGQIVEVSLVDRPANPTCTLALAKTAKPGMQVKASALDPKRMLVKTEELREEEPEVEQSAADEPAQEDAEPPEAPAEPPVEEPPANDANGEVSALLDEIKALMPALVKLAATAEIDPPAVDELITIPPTTEPDTPKAPEPETTKAAGPDIAELVKAAVTEASEASEERIKALEAELAKVQALPVPGGPVLTRTAEDTQKAAQKDARLTKAAEYRRLADQVTDPVARKGYLALADTIDAELAQ